MSADDSFNDVLGPVDFFVIEFPDGKIGYRGFDLLLKQVDNHVIRLLDLEFVRAGEDGVVEAVAALDLRSNDGFDFAQIEGAMSGILDEADFSEAASAIRPGSVAAIGIYEVLGMLPVFASWEADGGRLLGDGPVLADDLVAALDATEGQE